MCGLGVLLGGGREASLLSMLAVSGGLHRWAAASAVRALTGSPDVQGIRSACWGEQDRLPGASFPALLCKQPKAQGSCPRRQNQNFGAQPLVYVQRGG